MRVWVGILGIASVVCVQISLLKNACSGVAKGGPGRVRARPILSCSSHAVGSHTVNTEPILRIHSPDYVFNSIVSLYS